MKNLALLRINFTRYLFLINSIPSFIKIENSSSDGSILWLYDSTSSPDGYSLVTFALKLARKEELNLLSFGPTNFTIIFFKRFLFHLPSIIRHRNIYKFAFHLLKKQLLINKDIKYILTGSCNGFLMSVVKKNNLNIKILEIQHGILDESYLPLKCDVFYTRSKTSAELLKFFSPSSDIRILSNDLEIPPSRRFCIDSPSKIESITLWSKNPDGGITWQELAVLESGLVSFANKYKFDLYFKMHPRDNKLKFIYRHLWLRKNTTMSLVQLAQIAFLNKIKNNYMSSFSLEKSSRNLNISCFSTSLISESAPSDLIFNLTNIRPNIVKDCYSWIESETIENLKDLSIPFNVTEIK